MNGSRRLLYFCYGKQEIYDQAIYSILTLLHVAGRSATDWRVVVYCERPEAFAALPVETVAVDAAMLDAWLGPSDYQHRRKTCAIIDALERFGGQVIFIDSDTWFRRAPGPLFRRVGPRAACFHLCEGLVHATQTPPDNALVRQLESADYRLSDGVPVRIDRRTRMWNTGVVGVDASDLGRVREALTLSDAIWADADPAGAYGKKIHHAEQFAMGYAFGDCRLSEAADCVYHYWPAETKRRFTAILPDVIRSGLADLSPGGLAAVYARRPRESGRVAAKDRIKMALRRVALSAGIAVRGARRSVA